MRSARTFYRLSMAVGAAGALAIALTVGLAFRAFDVAILTAHELHSACHSMLPSRLTAGSLLVLVLVPLSVVVLVRGVRSTVRQLRARRRVTGTFTVRGPLADVPQRALVIEDQLPRAFCLGYLRPRIYISSGACERLNRDELAAVMEHEAHHARRRDPLRLLILHVLADALFFLPVLRRLHQRYAALAELAADEAAVHASRNPGPLASALLLFGEGGPTPGVVGIAPERVDHLLGETPRWEVPRSLLAGALATLTALFALIVVVADVIGPGPVDLAAFSAQLWAATITPAPLLLAAGVLALTRTRARTRR